MSIQVVGGHSRSSKQNASGTARLLGIQPSVSILPGLSFCIIRRLHKPSWRLGYAESSSFETQSGSGKQVCLRMVEEVLQCCGEALLTVPDGQALRRVLVRDLSVYWTGGRSMQADPPHGCVKNSLLSVYCAMLNPVCAIGEAPKCCTSELVKHA